MKSLPKIDSALAAVLPSYGSMAVAMGIECSIVYGTPNSAPPGRFPGKHGIRRTSLAALQLKAISRKAQPTGPAKARGDREGRK